MKYIMAAVLLALSLSTSALSYAAENTEITAGNIFSSQPGEDFGQKVINFVAGGGNPSYMEQSLLSTVSRFINLGALSMMAWLAVLGATTFVIQTGNKGTPGGQVISSFWMPIRISTAVILLVPLSSGYSTLQYGVITIAEKGNSFGNTIQAAGLNWLYENGTYRAPALQDGSGVILSWVASEVCKQYINDVTDYETIRGELRSTVVNPPSPDNYKIFKTGYYYDHTEPGDSARNSSPRKNYCGSIEFSMERGESFYYDKDGNRDNLKAGMNSIMPGQFYARQNRDEYSSGYSGPEEVIKKHEEILEALQPMVAEIASTILSDQEALSALVNQGESAQGAFEQARAEANNSAPAVLAKMQSAVRKYNSMTQSAVAKTVNEIVDKKNGGESWVDQTNRTGWPGLGTIFWQQSMSQMQINKLASAFSATANPNRVDDDFSGDTRLAEINGRINGLMTLKRFSGENPGNITFDMYNLSAIADAGSEGRGFMDGFKNMTYDMVSYIFKAMTFKNGDDPIVNMQYFGTVSGSVSENAYWIKTITTSIMVGVAAGTSHGADGAKNSADNAVLGLGAIIGAPASAATGFLKGALVAMETFFNQTAPFFNTLILYLLILGLVLGVVLPTIPLIQWFMGFISWLLFFVECLLVSPMWLAAHGTAEKEGWGTEHTRQGYMLMIGLFLAPALRVCGFFAILLLMRPIGVLMSWMIDYINGVIVAGWVNPFLLIGAMGVVAIFSYTAMVRIFSLPSELFERGLRWINGGQEVTGDSSAEKETRNVVAAFSSKSEAAGHRSSPKPYSPYPTPASEKGSQNGNSAPKSPTT